MQNQHSWRFWCCSVIRVPQQWWIGARKGTLCAWLCAKSLTVFPHAIIVCASERRGWDGWSTVWIRQMRCGGALQQPSGVFVLPWCWPEAGSAFAQGLLQDAAWAGAIEKSGRGQFAAGLGVGVGWRWLSPGTKRGCSAGERRGRGKCFVTGLYLHWHK